jgi:hypothetical protein
LQYKIGRQYDVGFFSKVRARLVSGEPIRLFRFSLRPSDSVRGRKWDSAEADRLASI